MSNNDHFDVTIVGAGPAGSVLAYELARQGVKVLILEKAKLPRTKVCAGGITIRASSLLPFDISKSDLVLDVIFGVRMMYRTSQQKVRLYDKPIAYTVMREQFDNLLTSMACRSGAVLEEGVEVKHIEIDDHRVTVKTNSSSFQTPVLVGADGANSVVVQSLGLKKGFDYGLGLNGHVAVASQQYDLWDGLIGVDLGVPGGYSWVFPKSGYLSVGAGGSFKVAKNLRPYTLQMMQAFNIPVNNPQEIRGHLMPIRKARTPIGFPRVLLIGDAAGLIDPLSGEGIYYALRSVYMASLAIIRFLEGKTTDLSEYQAAVDTELMPEFRIARSVQKINSAAPYIFFKCLRNRDRFWRGFCRMLRGEKTYASLKQSVPQPLRLLLFNLL